MLVEAGRPVIHMHARAHRGEARLRHAGIRERELEMQAAEARLASAGDSAAPPTSTPSYVERSAPASSSRRSWVGTSDV